jgi:FkbM family methyltransferase
MMNKSYQKNMYDHLNIPILNQIPMTRIRISIARILYCILHFVLRKDNHLICRKGVRYDVDLSEGIDLSIFLFGNFQNHVINMKYLALTDSTVAIDVGANVGSMALRIAKFAPKGHVFAFEPTDYAFNKLLRNLALNPELAERITPVQLFLTDQTKSNHQIKAYSSWKIDGSGSKSHPLHGGTLKAADSIPAVNIDDFCREKQIQMVNLIKIDTDGHEFPVMEGARKTIENHHPYLIFETGLYVLHEQGRTFEQYFEYLSSYNYTLINSKNGKKITLENFHQQIPLRSTIDIVAVPPKSPSRGSIN